MVNSFFFWGGGGESNIGVAGINAISKCSFNLQQCQRFTLDFVYFETILKLLYLKKHVSSNFSEVNYNCFYMSTRYSSDDDNVTGVGINAEGTNLQKSKYNVIPEA